MCAHALGPWNTLSRMNNVSNDADSAHGPTFRQPGPILIHALDVFPLRRVFSSTWSRAYACIRATRHRILVYAIGQFVTVVGLQATPRSYPVGKQTARVYIVRLNTRMTRVSQRHSQICEFVATCGYLDSLHCIRIVRRVLILFQVEVPEYTSLQYRKASIYVWWHFVTDSWVF